MAQNIKAYIFTIYYQLIMYHLLFIFFIFQQVIFKVDQFLLSLFVLVPIRKTSYQTTANDDK